MRSRLLSLTVLLIIICTSCQSKKKTEPEKETVTGATCTSLLRKRGTESWVALYEGKYYYTQGSESRIVLWETSDIINLNDSLRKPVRIPVDPSNSHHLWASETHRINDKWCIYFAVDDGSMDDHQIYATENEVNIPMEGKFAAKGRISTGKDSNWAIYASTPEHNGQRYMTWCEW